ncbi:MAG: DUF4394 domain-containing protein, partial [Nitrososphaera sp.]
AFGFDFNPVPDRIRVVSDFEQNLRLNPNNGALAGTDTDLEYAVGDPNEGQDPNIVGAAYTNNFAGATVTTLYGIDSNLDILVTQGGPNGIPSPNGGQLFTVGSLGVNTSDLVGFDISAVSARAFAVLSVGGLSQLYTIDLTTGDATLVGNIASGATSIRGLAVVPPPVNLFAVNTGNNILKFNSATPGNILDTTPITGLQPGENVLGIDFRPATGQLFALGSTSRLYTINAATGAATQVGTPGAFTLDGTAFGFDFNPVPDRIRVVSDFEQNLRLNPNDGALAGTDTDLEYALGDPNEGQDPNIVGAAYTNNFAGSMTTTLYDIDSNLDILVRQGGVNVPPGAPSPNGGQLFTIGPLGVDTSDLVGFDIITADSDLPFAALTAPGAGASQLYTINLSTGAATQVGTIGGMGAIRGLSASLIADLAVIKSDSPDPVTKGNDLVYTITVTNNGPDTAAGVSLTDTLPVSVDFVSATPSQGSCSELSGIVTCDLFNLIDDDSLEVVIIVTTTETGDITNTVTVTSNEFDPNTNNTATITTTVRARTGGCAIGGAANIEMAAVNVLIPLTPLFAVGFRMLRRKRK